MGSNIVGMRSGESWRCSGKDTAVSSVFEMLQKANEPYRGQQELLNDELVVTRCRLRIARDHYGSPHYEGATFTWPSDIVALEGLIRTRVQLSDRVRDVPLAELSARFYLSESEERVLWLLIAHELCPISRGLIRELNTENSSDPTRDTIRRAVYGFEVGTRAEWHELGDAGALRRFGLIERTDGSADAPLHRQTWKVSDRVLGLVHGEVALDPALSRIATLELPHCTLDELEVGDDVLRQLEEAFQGTTGIVIACGRAGSGRRSSLVAVASRIEYKVLQVDGRSISKEPESARRELRSLARECALLDLVPLFRDLDALAGNGSVADRLDLVESEFTGLILATAPRPVPRHWKCPIKAIELPSLSGSQRAVLWKRAIPSLHPEAANNLATLFPLAPALIHTAGAIAMRHAGSGPLEPRHVSIGLRSILDDRLAGLATRITTTQTWADMVLPEDQTTLIAELMARIRERRLVYEDWGFAAKVGKALGVSALFSGPPGTGKTMAAGLIARELGVELYQVDLSKVVSKWIGETEKNLASLFDAAEAGHAIILFDEADSLFAKRTEVKSSNDRYANQEVNFLLQRMETFAGIVILTTNHETAIDEAFRRRLSLHVQFPMPECDERLKLWRALIPKDAPTVGALSLEKLADKFEMSGGYIRNAVLRAAFLAASERKKIDAGHLARAAHLEYEAMGKIASRV